jgi:hypothetical protein
MIVDNDYFQLHELIVWNLSQIQTALYVPLIIIIVIAAYLFRLRVVLPIVTILIVILKMILLFNSVTPHTRYAVLWFETNATIYFLLLTLLLLISFLNVLNIKHKLVKTNWVIIISLLIIVSTLTFVSIDILPFFPDVVHFNNYY